MEFRGAEYIIALLYRLRKSKSGKGELTVERTYLVAKDGKYVPMSKSDTPKTGDRIRVDYTITAARDFDFVSLQDARPACLEPVKQMSGYMERRRGILLCSRRHQTRLFL